MMSFPLPPIVKRKAAPIAIKMDWEDVEYFHKKFQRDVARNDGSEKESAAQLIFVIQRYMDTI